MNTINHHNYNYSGNIPENISDRQYSQDIIRDFRYLQSFTSDLMTEVFGDPPRIISGGVVSQGTGAAINITQFRGITKFSVEVPNSFASIPPTKQSKDISTFVWFTAKTNLALTGGQINDNLFSNATLDGATVNYVKVRYKELNGSTRNKAKAAGSYTYENIPSYEIRIEPVVNTSYEILIGKFTSGAGGAGFAIVSGRGNVLQIGRSNSDELIIQGFLTRIASSTGSVMKWDNAHQMITSHDNTGNSNWKAGVDESNNYSNAGVGGTDRGGTIIRHTYEPAVGGESNIGLEVYEASDAAGNNGTPILRQARLALNELSLVTSFNDTPGGTAQNPFAVFSPQHATVPNTIRLGHIGGTYKVNCNSLLSMQNEKYIENYVNVYETDQGTDYDSGAITSGKYRVSVQCRAQKNADGGLGYVAIREGGSGGTIVGEFSISTSTNPAYDIEQKGCAEGIINGTQFYIDVINTSSGSALIYSISWERIS